MTHRREGSAAITGTTDWARLAPYRPTVVRDSSGRPDDGSMRSTLTASVCAA